jgi:hypothetical protein
MVTVIVIMVGLALIAGGAVVYFTMLRPKAAAHEALGTIEAYFNAAGSGDTQTVKSLHTSENQPSDEELRVLSMTSDFMTMSYGHIDLETVKESGDEMEVAVKDYSLTISTMGQSETIDMSKLQSQLGFSSDLVVKLKKENGKWLINEPDVISPLAGMVPEMPDIPSCPSGT